MTMNNTAGAAGTAQSQTQTEGAEGRDFDYDADSAPAFRVAPKSEGSSRATSNDDGSQAQEQNPGEPNAEPADGAGETEGDGGDDGSEGAGSPDGDKRNNVPAKTRIKQLSDRAKAAEQRERTATARAQRLETELAALQGRERPGEAVDYETDAAYTQALVKESVDAARQGWLEQQRIDAANEANEARAEKWTEVTEEMRRRAPDFDAVITNPALTITEFMRDSMMEDPHGPEIAYYLGKNPSEAAGIARMAPLQQAAAIGRLSERLGAPVARKQTQVGKPPVVLKGHGSPSPQRDPSKMSNEEYRAWRAGHMKARAGMR